MTATIRGHYAEIGPIGERPKVLYWEGHDSPEIDCKSCLRSITEFELLYMHDEFFGLV